MSHESPGGGPYREAADPNAIALENMRKKIETEGKRALLVPEGIKKGDILKEFIGLIDKVSPEDIVLYSAATGRLELEPRDEFNLSKGKEILYVSPNSHLYRHPPVVGIILEEQNRGVVYVVRTIKEAEDSVNIPK